MVFGLQGLEVTGRAAGAASSAPWRATYAPQAAPLKAAVFPQAVHLQPPNLSEGEPPLALQLSLRSCVENEGIQISQKTPLVKQAAWQLTSRTAGCHNINPWITELETMHELHG